jgi:hypothetical protein
MSLLLLLLTEIDLSLGGSTDKTSIDHYINILLANDAHSVHHGACKLHLAWHQKYNYRHFFHYLTHNIHLKSRAAEICKSESNKTFIILMEIIAICV